MKNYSQKFKCLKTTEGPQNADARDQLWWCRQVAATKTHFPLPGSSESVTHTLVVCFVSM